MLAAVLSEGFIQLRVAGTTGAEPDGYQNII